MDDLGNSITLKHPAQKIISLAPHLTELVFAAGAEKYLIGVDSHSDYPTVCKKISKISFANQIDAEKILALEPNLILAWYGGNSTHQIAKLKAAGIAVFWSDPLHLQNIPVTIKKIGVLAGTQKQAEKSAFEFTQRLQELKQKYSSSIKLKIFYQIWHAPLITIGKKSWLNEAFAVCRAENIFSSVNTRALQVSLEAVLSANPDVVLLDAHNQNFVNFWQAWPQLSATQKNNFFIIPADLLQRFSPRILDGVAFLCESIHSSEIAP